MIWLLVIYALWCIAGALWVILRCERVASTWAWVLAMIVCAPLSTLLFYILNIPAATYSAPKRWYSYSRLQNVVANGCGASLTLHNRVRPLHSGRATFAALMRDVQCAKSEINIEYYILDCDSVGCALLELLMRRARAGVKIRIIYDSIGSWHFKRAERGRIARSGIEIKAYAPLRFPLFTRMVHRRNHRKVVVIDNRIAYLGGVNVAGRYMHGGKLGLWRDEHLRIEGAAAQHLHSLFAEDWRAIGGHINSSSLPLRPIKSICPIQIIWAQEGVTRMTIHHTFIQAIASARHNIRIATPYFLPSDELLETIIVAARGGVTVELLLPRVSDVRIVGLAAEYYVERCIDAGVEVYRYGAGFMHAKTICIDESVVIVGSANMDYRSLYYNMETSAIIYNQTVVRDYISCFMSDIALSERVLDTDFAHRSTSQHILQGLVRLLAPVL